MTIHETITDELLISAIESIAYLGFCAKCGCEHEGIEPDVWKVRCESCGFLALSGAESLILAGKFHVSASPS